MPTAGGATSQAQLEAVDPALQAQVDLGVAFIAGDAQQAVAALEGEPVRDVESDHAVGVEHVAAVADGEPGDLALEAELPGVEAPGESGHRNGHPVRIDLADVVGHVD